jgi:hypothetical protein
MGCKEEIPKSKKAMDTLTSGQTKYRGYTIEPTERPYDKGFDFFPSDPGRDDDYDLVGEDYKYCGNVRFASTIEEAKNEIDRAIEDELIEGRHVCGMDHKSP